jgi:hypothetical protein
MLESTLTHICVDSSQRMLPPNTSAVYVQVVHRRTVMMGLETKKKYNKNVLFIPLESNFSLHKLLAVQTFLTID